MISENSLRVFKQRYSVDEFFLLYQFYESTYSFFKEKTNFYSNSADSVVFIDQKFNNLKALMTVTVINIENYVRFLIMRLNESFFKTTELAKMITELSERLGLVNVISRSLSSQIWSLVLDLIVESYIGVFFKTAVKGDLEGELKLIGINSNILKEFFGEFVPKTTLDEQIHKIVYLAHYIKATQSRTACLESLKYMIHKNMVYNDANLLNMIKIKSSLKKGYRELFEELRQQMMARLAEFSVLNAKSEVNCLPDRLLYHYFYLYCWVHKKNKPGHGLFTRSKKFRFT